MLSEVQRIVAAALHDDAPLARLRALVLESGGAALAPDERAWLLSVDEDGFRTASLLVRKLRFERALRGDRSLAARFDADPAAFAGVWARYERDVPPSAEWPAEEAAAFAAWERSRRPLGPATHE